MIGDYTMYNNNRALGIFAFWITVILGILLPIITFAIINMLNDKTIGNILNDIVDVYFKDYTDIGFLFWFFQSLIFLILAFLVKSKIQISADTTKSSIIEYSQAVGAWIFAVVFSIIMNIDVLVSKSSTAVIAYIFIPFYEVIMILIGYLLGWIIGKIILWNRTTIKIYHR